MLFKKIIEHGEMEEKHDWKYMFKEMRDKEMINVYILLIVHLLVQTSYISKLSRKVLQIFINY